MVPGKWRGYNVLLPLGFLFKIMLISLKKKIFIYCMRMEVIQPVSVLSLHPICLGERINVPTLGSKCLHSLNSFLK